MRIFSIKKDLKLVRIVDAALRKYIKSVEHEERKEDTRGRKTEMTDKNTRRLIAVMRSFEHWSKLSQYNMWGKSTGSYNFKIQELNHVNEKCPRASQSSMLALDAGCGFGVYSSMLTHKGYHAIGLDVSSGMLKKAKSLFGRENISFVRGSITNLPFKRSKFIIILCVDTLHHLTNSHFTETLQEFARVIRPHGLLVSDTRNALNPLLWIRYRLCNRKWAERGELTLVARSLKHVEKRLKESGFKPVEVKRIGLGRINRSVGLIAPYIVVFARACGTLGDSRRNT